MTIYKVPFDIKREEKIFGGYLSLRQVTYLMLAASSLSILATPMLLAMKIMFIAVVSIFFLLCTFLKVSEQNFDRFFFFAIKFMFRQKNLIYQRCYI